MRPRSISRPATARMPALLSGQSRRHHRWQSAPVFFDAVRAPDPRRAEPPFSSNLSDAPPRMPRMSVGTTMAAAGYAYVVCGGGVKVAREPRAQGYDLGSAFVRSTRKRQGAVGRRTMTLSGRQVPRSSAKWVFVGHPGNPLVPQTHAFQAGCRGFEFFSFRCKRRQPDLSTPGRSPTSRPIDPYCYPCDSPHEGRDVR